MPIVNVYKEKELKNAYIGEYRVPGENTIAYYPLTSETTVNDMSGNNRNLTNSWLSFSTYQGVDCANGNSVYAHLSDNLWTYNQITLSLYGYNADSASRYFASIWWYWNLDLTTHHLGYYQSSSLYWQINLADYKLNKWQHLCAVINNGTMYLYQNGVLIWSMGTAGSVWITWWISVWTNCVASAATNERLIGGVSEFIIENKARTAQEIADYYNLTKSNYGL